MNRTALAVLLALSPRLGFAADPAEPTPLADLVAQVDPAQLALYTARFGIDFSDEFQALADLDRDGLTALEEAKRNTDPDAPDTDRDGLIDALDPDPTSRAVMYWGDPAFTDGDVYSYFGPVWFLGARRDGGDWSEEGWRPAALAKTSSLCLQVDCALFSGDLVLELDVSPSPVGPALARGLAEPDADGLPPELYVDLCDAKGRSVALDLFGNLLQGEMWDVELRRIVPMSQYPVASEVRLRSSTPDVTVVQTLLYLDEPAHFIAGGPGSRRAATDQWTRRVSPMEDPASLPESAGLEEEGGGGFLMLLGGETDTDEDGLPDDWEIEYGLNPTSGVSPYLVGWWTFDEGAGTNVADSSGSGYDGVAFNLSTSSWIAGKSGGAIQFNGTSTYVSIPQSPPLITGTQYTLSAWVRYDSTATSHYGAVVADLAMCGSQYDGYWMGHDNDYAPVVLDVFTGSCTNGDYAAKVQSNQVSFANRWVHLVGTFDGATLRIYADGQRTESVSAAFRPAQTASVQIGGRGAQGEWWKGAIDDVRIYSVALSSNEVATMTDAFHDNDLDGLDNLAEYANGTDPHDPDTDGDFFTDGIEVAAGTDPADPGDHPGLTYGLVSWWRMNEGAGTVFDHWTNGWHAVLTNGAAWNTGMGKTGILLDGIDDKAQTLAVTNAGQTAFSLACWVRPHTFSTTSDMYLGRKFNAWVWYLKRNDSRPYLDVMANYMWQGWTSDTNGLSANEWTHVAVTYADGVVKYFQDGVVSTTASKQYTLGASHGIYFLGNNWYYPAGLDGEMHDFRFYNWALPTGLVHAICYSDLDVDGLSARAEHDLGLNPNVADTDGDGLLDGIDASPLEYDTSEPVFTVTYPTNGLVIP